MIFVYKFRKLSSEGITSNYTSNILFGSCAILFLQLISLYQENESNWRYVSLFQSAFCEIYLNRLKSRVFKLHLETLLDANTSLHKLQLNISFFWKESYLRSYIIKIQAISNINQKWAMYFLSDVTRKLHNINYTTTFRTGWKKRSRPFLITISETEERRVLGYY